MVIPRVLSRGTSGGAAGAFQGHPLGRSRSAGGDLQQPLLRLRHRADLFFALREEHPNLVGFKEFGGAADLRYAASTSPAATRRSR